MKQFLAIIVFTFIFNSNNILLAQSETNKEVNKEAVKTNNENKTEKVKETPEERKARLEQLRNEHGTIGNKCVWFALLLLLSRFDCRFCVFAPFAELAFVFMLFGSETFADVVVVVIVAVVIKVEAEVDIFC